MTKAEAQQTIKERTRERDEARVELARLQQVEKDYASFRFEVMRTAFALKDENLPGKANAFLHHLCVFPAPHKVVAP